MKFVGNNIALEFEDLLAAGLSYNTLTYAKSQGLNSWKFFKDDSDQRKVLIFWNDLQQKYRELVRKALGEPEQVIAAQMITPYLVCPDKDMTVIRSYTDEQGRYLSPELQLRYTTACAYLNLLNCTKAVYSTIGFPSRNAFESAVITMIRINQVQLPENSKSLLRKLKAYRELGALAVISRKIGNSNRVVLDSLQRTWLISAYSDHRKPSVEQIYNMYIQQCKEMGWPVANLRTIRRFLADSATKQIVDIERDPKLWKDRFAYTIHTKKPDVPGALYESDGTKLNLFYRDDKGKTVAGLQMYVVVDVASEAFIGYSFGMSEDMTQVKNAYRMAIKRGAILPHQTRFDNGGAHKSAVVEEFINQVSSIHFRAQAYNGQSKYIEGIIGRFQQKHLRLFHNFTGMNITAKSDNSRLNTAFLKSNAHLIPSLPDCIAQAVEAFEAWNHTVTKRGVSRIEFFEKNKQGRMLTDHDRVMIMYDTRQEVTYRKDGIELIAEGSKLFFEVCDGDRPDMEFYSNNIGRKFGVRWNPEDTSHIYLTDIESNRIVAKAERATEMVGATLDYHEGSRTALNQRLDLKKQQAARAIDFVTRAKEDYPVELSHSNSYKDALNSAEGEYLVQSINDSPRLPKAAKKKDIMLPDDFVEGRILDDEDEF
jgi:hypothetical protein